MRNAILWKLRTGARWRELPERYEPGKAAHKRLRLRTAGGTWQKILDEFIVKEDSPVQAEWIISIDSTVIRARQHAAYLAADGRGAAGGLFGGPAGAGAFQALAAGAGG